MVLHTQHKEGFDIVQLEKHIPTNQESFNKLVPVVRKVFLEIKDLSEKMSSPFVFCSPLWL